ncbi:MAG: TRAP transporter small permease subunit [Actinomycetia bacterium]|nr:TRAP transporter small permease subunit [Actinomycetes bacterium]
MSLKSVFNRLHPAGWVTVGFLVLSIVATVFTDTDFLIGRLPWWLWLVLILIVGLSAAPDFLHRIRLGLEAVSRFTGSIVWKLAWLVFIIQLFNVITRYTNNWFETDILFGQTTSLAWMSFGLLFLIGVNYGVWAGVNPRIDFWWANFSNRRKAWIDFVFHVTLFLPFLIMGIRALIPYSAINLGRRFDGTWPSGWKVWQSWVEATDADQLPTGPIRAFILVGFILWAMQIVAEIIKTGFVIIGRDDLGEVKESDVPLRVE